MSTPSPTPPKDHCDSHTWVIASSGLFFIPAVVALFRQSLLISIILLSSALFSTLYHASTETSYAELDVFFASLALIIAVIMLLIVASRYGVLSWRFFCPFSLGLAGLIVYFVEGQFDPVRPQASCHYDLFHSLWHLLLSIAAFILVMTPVDVSLVKLNLVELFSKSQRNTIS